MNPEEALTKVPALLKKGSLEAFERRKGIENLRLQLKLKEADLGMDIASAKDDEGKPRFKNADQRDAALRRLLESDPSVAALRRQLAEDEALVQRIEAHMDYLRHVQFNARVLIASRSPLSILFDEAPA